MKEDNRTPEELTRMLEEYMTQLCIRYANQPNVQWIDVVNETIAKENVKDPVFGDQKRGEWFGARQGTSLWENPWTIIGFDEESEIHTPLYINKAFEIATQYAPSGVKLIINQHGNFEEVVWERMKKLVSYLREKGYRVDGLGWQAHIDTGWEKNRYWNKTYHSYGVEISADTHFFRLPFPVNIGFRTGYETKSNSMFVDMLFSVAFTI